MSFLSLLRSVPRGANYLINYFLFSGRPGACHFVIFVIPSASTRRNQSFALSLGSVFQFPVLCRLQASFRDLGQNSALRRPVDSATCGPELKQSLGLKSACKEPPNGFKGPPASSFAGLRLANQHQLLRFSGSSHTSELPNYSQAFWQLAALPSRFLATRRPTNRFLVARRPISSSSQAASQ